MFDEGSSKGMPYYKYREELEGLKIRLKVEHLFDENEDKLTCPFIDPSTKTKVENFRRTGTQGTSITTIVTPQELQLYEAFLKASKEYNQNIIKAIFIFKDTSSERLWDKVLAEFGNSQISKPNSKVLRTVDKWYQDKFGSYNLALDEELNKRFNNILPFRNVLDFEEGIQRCKEIDRQKKAWNTVDIDYRFSTIKLKTWLIDNLKGWEDFAITRGELIQLPDNTTWENFLARED